MIATTKPHILCVDDEPQVLESIKLNLRRSYSVSTALNGVEALTVLSQSQDIAVIVSDMRMPSMNGAVFLAKARQLAPDAVRMLLTGQSDIDTAIAAVNDGQIFRFLTKPCAPTVLLDAMAAAVTQNRLITSERVLLQKTLHGSIKALTEILALVNPIAFGRTMRICKIANELAEQVQLQERWQLEIAAMLSQIGNFTLPERVAEKAYYGLPLSTEESRLVKRLPATVASLLTNIPRIEVVLAILRSYSVIDDTASDTRTLTAAEAMIVRQGAEILKLAIDFDILESANGTPFKSIYQTLCSRSNMYVPSLLEALGAIRGTPDAPDACRLALRELRIGMVFAEDVIMPSGTLLVARGYQITERVLDRMKDIFPVNTLQVQWAVYQ